MYEKRKSELKEEIAELRKELGPLIQQIGMKEGKEYLLKLHSQREALESKCCQLRKTVANRERELEVSGLMIDERKKLEKECEDLKTEIVAKKEELHLLRSSELETSFEIPVVDFKKLGKKELEKKCAVVSAALRNRDRELKIASAEISAKEKELQLSKGEEEKQRNLNEELQTRNEKLVADNKKLMESVNELKVKEAEMRSQASRQLPLLSSTPIKCPVTEHVSTEKRSSKILFQSISEEAEQDVRRHHEVRVQGVVREQILLDEFCFQPLSTIQEEDEISYSSVEKSRRIKVLLPEDKYRAHDRSIPQEDESQSNIEPQDVESQNVALEDTIPLREYETHGMRLQGNADEEAVLGLEPLYEDGLLSAQTEQPPATAIPPESQELQSTHPNMPTVPPPTALPTQEIQPQSIKIGVTFQERRTLIGGHLTIPLALYNDNHIVCENIEQVPYGAEGFRIFALSGENASDMNKKRREDSRSWSKGAPTSIGQFRLFCKEECNENIKRRLQLCEGTYECSRKCSHSKSLQISKLISSTLPDCKVRIFKSQKIT